MKDVERLVENVKSALEKSLGAQPGDGVLILTDSQIFAEKTKNYSARKLAHAFKKAADNIKCEVAMVDVPLPRPVCWERLFVTEDTELEKVVKEVDGLDGKPVRIIPKEEWNSPVTKTMDRLWAGMDDKQKIALTPVSSVVENGNDEVGFRIAAINLFTRNEETCGNIPKQYKMEFEHGRLAHMPGVTYELAKYFDTDYKSIAERGRRIKEVLNEADKIEIKSDETHLLVGVGGIELTEEYGFILNPGEYSNLPSGEIYYPKVNYAYGRFLCNLTTGIGTPSEPVLLFIKGAKLEGETGNWKIQTKDLEFKRLVEAEFDKYKSLIVDEVGFGLNTEVKKITGNMLADEKKWNSIHMALGVPGIAHYDFLHGNPALEVIVYGNYPRGNRHLMREGKYLA